MWIVYMYVWYMMCGTIYLVADEGAELGEKNCFLVFIIIYLYMYVFIVAGVYMYVLYNVHVRQI